MDKYVIDGQEFTTEQLTSEASSLGLSLEELLKEYNAQKVTEDQDFQIDPAKEAALVESQKQEAAALVQETKDLDLSPEDTSSVLSGQADIVGVKSDDLDAYQYILPKSNQPYTGRELVDSVREAQKKPGGYRESMSDDEVLKLYLNGFGRGVKKELVPSRTISIPEVTVTGESKESQRVREAVDQFMPSEEALQQQDQGDVETAAGLFVPYEEQPLTKFTLSDDYRKFGMPSIDISDDYNEYLEKANPDVKFEAGVSGVYSNATEEHLKKAQELYVKDKRDGRRSENLRNALDEAQSEFSNIPVLGKLFSIGFRTDALQRAIEKDVRTIDENTKKNLKKDVDRIKLLEQDLSINKNRISELDVKIKNKTATLEDFAERKIAGEKINANLDLFDQTYNNLYRASAKNLNDNALILDVVKREYGNVPNLAGKAIASTADIAAGVLNIPEWLAVTMGEAVGVDDDVIASALQQYFPASTLSKTLSNASTSIRETLEKPKEVQDINSLTDFGTWASDLIGNQIPQYGAMFLAPTYGFYAVAASAGGNKYASMREMEDEMGVEYNAWQWFSAPVITAAAEYFTEKITLGQIKRVRGLLTGAKGAARNEVLDASKKFIREEITKGRFIKDTFKEGGGEGIATFVENAVDIAILGDKQKNIWDGVSNAIASGAFMSGVVLKAPVIGSYALKPFITKDYSQQLGKNFQMIAKLEKELQKPDLSDKIKNSIRKDIFKITENSNKLLLNTFKNIDQLSDSEKQSLINNNAEFQKIRNEAQQILADKNLSQEIKDYKIEELQTQVNKLAKEKQDILVDAETRRQTETIIKAKDSGLVKDLEIQKFKDTTALGDWLVANKSKYSIIKNVKDSKLREDAETYGTILQRADGSQTILLNEDVAKQDNVVTTAAHEFLHALLYKTVKGSVSTQVNLGNELLNELKTLSDGGKELSLDFKQRVASYAKQKNNSQILNLNTQEDLLTYINTQRDSEGNLNGDQFEEVMTLLSESIISKDIVFNETAISKLGDMIRRFFQDNFGMSIKFNTGKDVLNFVRDYAASVEKGNLARSKAFKKLGTEGAAGALVKKPTKSPATAAKESRKVRSKKDLETTKESLNKIGRENKNNSIALQSGRNAEIIGKELMGMVEVQVDNRFQNLGEDLRQLLISDVIERLYISGEIYRFDGRGELYGYINDRIKFRILDAVKKNPDYLDKTTKTQIEDLQKDIVAEESVPSVKQDRKTYTTFLGANAFPDNVIDSATEKLISIVRVLKNKIDAPVSKNRTVTPLIAEIKKDAGKQLDIIIKKYLGSKQDGELRRNFLNLKKTALENATTTWLMKAMPFAVQKQIDGKFVSYPGWVGKKIDRETTSTDSAGRTSGAEIVRRLPNADKAISADEFLSYLFKDGEVIRGRKEAFSKMVAEELAFELISYDFENNGAISEALAANQERIGAEVGANLGAEFNRQVERGNIKFSAKRPLKQHADIYENLLKTNISGPAFNAYRKQAMSTYNLSKEQFNELVGELVENNFGEFIRQRAIKGVNLGVAYEKLTNAALKLTAKNITSKLNKGQNGDLRLIFEDATEAVIELKLNENAQFGSFSIQKLFNEDGSLNENFSFTNNLSIGPKLRDIILQNKSKLESLAKNALNNNGKINPGNGKIHYPSYIKGGQQHKTDWANTRKENQDYIITLDGFNEQGIVELYTKKNINLIQIGGKGLFALSNSNIAKGLTPFKADVQYVIRPTISKGELTFRVFPLVTKISNANHSLENKTGASKLAENANMQDSAMKQSKRRLSGEFNDMLDRTKGVPTKTRFSQVGGRIAGSKKGKFRPFLPPSAEDFEGLLYNFLGKGKQGEADLKFFNDTLILPYTRGISELEKTRQELKNNYTSILRAFPGVKKQLSKPIPNSQYTYDQAIRVYLWTQAGYEIPGLSQKEKDKLNKEIGKSPDMMALAEGVKGLIKGQKYPKPSEYWNVDSLLSELNDLTQNVNRAEYLKEFLKNKNKIFSASNLAKIEATYGKNFKQALENILYRMETGSNRPTGTDKFTQAINTYLNGSVGTIMFFNRRSALLQLLSTINFINYKDNNPLQAAAAFANQPQFWKDFSTIFNSAKLKERRGGLKSDVQDQEIAEAAKAGGVKAVVSKILKIGFLPTQIADSFAIAFGGATFYRNRINSYIKKGYEPDVAAEAAWEDFSLISEKTQQSGDPMLISQQQASVGGRFILAFQNTPMQMTRIMKKAALDLINRRGSDKENITKILYYGAVQNALFGALQNALFALLPGFDDDDEEETTEQEEKRITQENKRVSKMLNGMLDTLMRGSGIYGAIGSTLKNLYIEYKEESEKGIWAAEEDVLLAALNVSPQVGSKARKIVGMMRTKKFEKDVIAERGFDVMIDGRFQVSPSYNIAGDALSLANVPLDRVIAEVNGITEALDARNTTYQRIALALGWRTWDVNAEIEEHDLIKTTAKAERKVEGKKKAAETRKRKKIEEIERLANMSEAERKEFNEKKRKMYEERARKAATTRERNLRIQDSINTIGDKPIKIKM